MDFINTNISAYVTSQARLKLYTYLERLQERVLYFDTGKSPTPSVSADI